MHMVRRTVIFLSILIVVQMNAMQDLNFFSKIPQEVWDLIAQYLTFNDIETEEEFIERTKRMIGVKNYKEISFENCKAYQQKYIDFRMIYPERGFFVQHYAKVNKIAVLHDRADLSVLHIVAADTEEELSAVSFYSCKPCTYLIGSSDAHLFAALHSVCDWETASDGNYKIIQSKQKLTIIDTIHKHSESFFIPENFLLPNFYVYGHKFPSMIAFNKQKTHVIMHGAYQKTDHSGIDWLRSNATDYCIMPLTTTAQKKPPAKKTLQYYFAQKGICKQISQ